MKKGLKIYFACIKAAFSAVAAYRFNFILSCFITLIGNILFPLVTILIYNAGATFPGWSFYEVLMIQAIFTVSVGVTGMLFGGVLWATMDHIRSGSFEMVLIKPLNPLFFLVSTNFQIDSLGLIFGGGVMYGIAAANTEGITLLSFGQSMFLFFMGLCVMMGIYMIMASTSFKWVGNSRIPEIFESVKNFGKYPMTVFPKIVQTLAAFVMPVAMVGFFPASALLGRGESYMYLAAIPCVLFMLLGIWLYNFMIRLYEGVGG